MKESKLMGWGNDFRGLQEIWLFNRSEKVFNTFDTNSVPNETYFFKRIFRYLSEMFEISESFWIGCYDLRYCGSSVEIPIYNIHIPSVQSSNRVYVKKKWSAQI